MSDLVFVYLFRSENNLYKIGMTTNSVNNRLMQCNVLSPIEVYHVAETYTDKNFESMMHMHFDKQRVRGEWFRLTNEDVEWIINKFSEVNMQKVVLREATSLLSLPQREIVR
jgi:hypothetical protein